MGIGNGARPAPARALAVAFSALLAVAMCVPAPVLSALSPRPALAASGTVHLVNDRAGNNVEYAGWNTHRMTAGGVPAYCATPAQNSPDTGDYEMSELTTKSTWRGSWQPVELAAMLYYGFGGPGWDEGRQYFPSTWYDGSAMDDNRYYVLTHIMVADIYANDGNSAIAGTFGDFRDWAKRNVIGWYDGGDNRSSTERMIADLNIEGSLVNRHREEMERFAKSCYILHTGSTQDIAGYLPQGHVQLRKLSADPSITDGNRCYSLEGAVYGVYSDSACTSEVERLTTGADGSTGEGSPLDAGTYYVKEISASKGYEVSDDVQRVVVSAGQTASVDCEEEPGNDPLALGLYKADAEAAAGGWSPDANAAVAGTSLAGAQFTVEYYDTLGDIDGEEPLRTWVFESDDKGRVVLNKTYYVSALSDPLYEYYGQVAGPIGTYTIRETRAPEDFLLPDGEGSTLTVQLTEDGELSKKYVGNESLRISDMPVRNDIELDKTDSRTGLPLEGVPFRVTMLDADGNPVSGMSHVIATNANGKASTSSAMARHSTRTNANDAAVAADGTVDSSKLSFANGVWFGATTDGGQTEPDDGRGALPAGRYLVEELACEANEGLQLTSRTVDVTSDSGSDDPVKVDIVNYWPTLKTTLSDADDGDKVVATDGRADIVDTVEVSSLEPNRKFTTKATLYDADARRADPSAAPLATASVDFESGNGRTATVHVPLQVDTSQLDGHSLVVFEELFDADGKGIGQKETDVDDAAQTVRVAKPKLATTAVDAADGDKFAVTDPAVEIDDAVAFDGTRAKTSYTVKGELVRKTDGGCEPLTVGGAPIVGQAAVSGQTSGTAHVKFSFDATKVDQGLSDGDVLVALERLYDADGNEVASHVDPEDRAQAVTYATPKVGTTAADSTTGTTEVPASEKTVVEDTVVYSGLVPNREYSVTGTLHYTSDGSAVDGVEPVTAKFTPDGPDGTVVVRFEFDTSKMASGTSIVAFESVSRDGVEVAAHADVSDRSQTVTVGHPGIGTTATEGGDHVASPYVDTEISDEVAFENLHEGDYRLFGILMDKSTGLPYVDPTSGVSSDDLRTWWESYAEALAIPAAQPDGSGTVAVASRDASFTWTGGTATGGLSAGSWSVSVPEGHELWKKAADGSGWAHVDGDVDVLDVPAEGSGGVAYQARVAGSDQPADDVEVTLAPAIGNAADGFQPAAPAKAAELLGNDVGKAVIASMADFSPEAISGRQAVSLKGDLSRADGGLVAFEALVLNPDGDAPETVAVHADVNDAGQTVTVQRPELKTTLVDSTDSDHVMLPTTTGKVVDTVEYDHLMPGHEYTVSGTLMDKATGKELYVNDQPVTASATFTPDTDHGTVEVAFDVDTSQLDGHDMVAFEKLALSSDKGNVLGSHEDIDDKAQTVKVDIDDGMGLFAKTGTDVLAWFALALALAAAAGVSIAAGVKRRRAAAAGDAEGGDSE